MHVMKFLPLSQFIESFRLIRKRPGLFALNLLVDFAFLIVFSAVYIFFAIGIMDKIHSLADSVTREVLQNVQPAENVFGMLLQVSALKPQLGLIVSMLFYLIIALFLVWLVFQATSWWLSFKINKIKADFFSHFASFTLFNFIWWALFVLVVYGFFRLSFHNLLYSGINQTAINCIAVLLLIIISYFELASYSIYGKLKETLRKLFRVAIKKAHLTILTYAIITVIFAVVYFASLGIFALNTVAGFIAGIILTTAAITFSRIYLISFINRI